MVQLARNYDTLLFNRSTFNVLVVDDEPLMRWSLENSLTKAGYRVTTVSSAEQAIERLHSSPYDLVITDMKLPRKDGFAVVVEAKEVAPRSTAVMISAFGDQTSRLRAKESGIEYFIDKPFDLAEMTVLVREILNRSGEGKE